VALTPHLIGLLGSLGAAGEPDAPLDWLCNTCTSELGVSGTSIALITGGHDPGVIAASDERASALVDLQFTLGEGPSIDAYESRQPVLEPDLAKAQRWPGFVPEATAAGIESVFALPMQIGVARFGALTLHRDQPGPLGHLADALVIADIASEITLCLQAQVPPGLLHEVVEDLVAQRNVVHQATGMILVQLEVSAEEALVALRARAYASGRPVGEVAADVVARRFRFVP
jgi:ANTAR domain